MFKTSLRKYQFIHQQIFVVVVGLWRLSKSQNYLFNWQTKKMNVVIIFEPVSRTKQTNFITDNTFVTTATMYFGQVMTAQINFY